MNTPYIELFAGSQQVSTTLVHFAADAGVIQEFTPLMLADNGEFKPWDGQASGKAVYLTSYPVDTSKQKSAQCYKTGIFNIAAVNWPESVDTDAKMRRLCGFWRIRSAAGPISRGNDGNE